MSMCTEKHQLFRECDEDSSHTGIALPTFQYKVDVVSGY